MTKTYITVIGHGLTVSDKSIEAIRLEFPTVEVNRTDEPEQLVATTKDVARLALVEEEILQQGLELDTLESLPAKYIALAYNDKSIARWFFNHVSEHAAFSRLGFLPMDLGYDCWISALRLLFLGHGCVPQEIMKLGPPTAMPGNGLSKPYPRPRLTPREREILELVACGKQNKLIAWELAVSEHTVKLHMHHIIKKLGVHNRTEAARIFLSNPLGSA